MATERRTQGARAPGRQPKHAGRALARAFASLNKLDKRTGLVRDFHAAQDALAADRGGWDNVTNGERVAIEVAAAELIITRAIFAWAIQQQSIITEGEDGPRLLGPLAKGFTSHTAQLVRTLAALGLRPDRADKAPDLGSYLAARAAAPAPPPPPPDATAAPVGGDSGTSTNPPAERED
ncbi:MAG: hypothetical protein ACRERC_15245 [Candidatus Binatia bacterium]